MGIEAKVLTGFGGVFQGLNGPLGAGNRVSAQVFRRKAVEHQVIRRMNSH